MKKFLSLLILCTMFISCEKGDVFGKADYSMEVTGSASNYSVTYSTSLTGGSQQRDPVSSGWKVNWQASGSNWCYISAQNNTSSGTVTVKIFRNGNLMNSKTSSGAYVIAQADGTY
jgi:hypothetical protein